MSIKLKLSQLSTKKKKKIKKTREGSKWLTTAQGRKFTAKG